MPRACRRAAAIFALLGLIDIGLLGVVGSSVAPPPAVSIIIAGLGLITLVALIPARNGHRRALLTAVAARLISAVLAAAAFFAGRRPGSWPWKPSSSSRRSLPSSCCAGRPGCRGPDHGP